MIKLTKNDLAEIGHKLGVLADTPDLQEDYGLTQYQADALLCTLPRGGGMWDIPEYARKAVLGEMGDHALVLRDIAADARSNGERGQALQCAKLAARLERMFEQ